MRRERLPRALRLALVLAAIVLVLLAAITLWLRREDQAARDFEQAAISLREGITVQELYARLPEWRGEVGAYPEGDKHVGVLVPCATARRWFCVGYKVPPSVQAPESQVIKAVRVYEVESVFGMGGRRRDEHIRAAVHAAVLQGSYPGVKLLHADRSDNSQDETPADVPDAEGERSEPGE